MPAPSVGKIYKRSVYYRKILSQNIMLLLVNTLFHRNYVFKNITFVFLNKNISIKFLFNLHLYVLYN